MNKQVNLKKEHRKRASEDAFKMIRKRIIEFYYEPNEHLNEENLTNEFGISRTPMREALFRLEIERLVAKDKTGKVYVTKLTVDEAKEIYKVREILQGFVVHEAALNMNKDVLSKLENTMNEMQTAANCNNLNNFSQCDKDYHMLFYETCNNQTAIHFLEQLRSRVDRYRRIGAYKHPNYTTQLTIEEHLKILNYTRVGDADRADQAMRQHIRNSLERIIATLEIIYSVR